MGDFTRRIVVDMGFSVAVDETSRALRDEGLQVISRLDVRDHFWSVLRRPFRQYVLLDVWAPDLALEALRYNLDLGPIVAATLAIYELPDGETVITAKEPFAPLLEEAAWRREAPLLADIADRETERVARVLDRVTGHLSGRASAVPAL